MTLPDERTRAVHSARTFLRSLLDPKETPRVPRATRQWASRVLRHYPSPVDFAIGPKQFEWEKKKHLSAGRERS